jgi:hypothetical protein
MSKMILAGGSAVSKPNAGGSSTLASQLNYKEIKNQEENSQNSSFTGTSWQNPVSASRQASIQDPRTSLKPPLPAKPEAKSEHQLKLSGLSPGLVGLQNYSYFCYLNSCL